MKLQFITTALPVSMLLLTSCNTTPNNNKTPNVIYILADDLGYGDLSCYGQTKFATPNIDAMAECGMRFTQHYAGCSVSAPSRNSLLTGQHTGHSYVRGNKGMACDDGRIYDTSLPEETITLGDIFQQSGYTTGCVGKWGLGGPNTVGHPNNQGFDYFYGYLGQGFAHSYFPEFLHENNVEVRLDGAKYSHDLVEDKAIEFIKDNKDNPFFLYLTFTLPHAELILPEQYMEPFEGKFDEPTPFVNNGGTYSSQAKPRQAFASMVTRLDTSVGRINALLKELNLDKNTLVIFASDNGAHTEGGADPQFFNSTGIYRGTKRALHEGGIRVPMIATYPGVIAPQSVNNDAVAMWDMMPTFCDLLSVDSPSSDGISILQTFNGDKLPNRERPLYWEFHEQGGRQAVRKGDWKLIKQNVNKPNKSYFELYNIAQDPSETNNLIKEEADIAESLKLDMMQSRSHSDLFRFPNM